jgi:hypothetical protein
MKKFMNIILVSLILCFALALPALANVTFIVPSGYGYAIDRDGNTYTPNAAGTISVPTKYVADFLNAGYTPLYQATYIGSGSTTPQATPKIYAGQVTMASASQTVTGLTFTSIGSFFCTANDQTASNAVKVSNSGATSVVLSGTGTDVVNYMCIGY